MKLDYNTKASTVNVDIIETTINPTIMVGDYAEAYFSDLETLNPVKFNQTTLTNDDLNYYFSKLLTMRVLSVHRKFKHWDAAKDLAIPDWIQHVMSQVGIYEDEIKGICILPNIDEDDYDFNRMIDISKQLKKFSVDGLPLQTDSFPRNKTGDKEVMSMVIVNDYVKSMEETSHPHASYVAGFLGNKLVQEQNWSMLFRVQYDDIARITRKLTNDVTVTIGK